MNRELDKARRKFLDECDMVVRSPAVWFLKGNEYSYSTHVFPIPTHIYMGIRRSATEKSLQMAICDGDTHLYNILPQNMKLLSVDDDLISFYTKHFLDLDLEKYIKELEKKHTFPKNWSTYTHFDDILQTVNELGNFKLKVWSELPLTWRHDRESIMNVAFSTLMHCLKHNLTPSQFNELKRKYKHKIVKNRAEITSLGLMAEQTKQESAPLYVINNIFKTAWLFSYGSNGAAPFSSLIGCIEGEPYLGRYLGLECGIPAPETFEQCANLAEIWWPKSLDIGVIPTLQFIRFLVENICGNKFNFKLPDTVSWNTHLIVIYWKDKERGLFGPLLEPLFLDSFPYEITTRWHEKHEKWPPSLAKSFSYSYNFLQVMGTGYLIDRIEDELKRRSYLSKVYYNSVIMPWEIEGTRVLEPREYKLITESEEKEINEIYFGLEPAESGNVRSIIKVNDKLLNMRFCPERVFVKLLYLAAVKLKRKDGWVKYEDLYLYEGEQGLDDILDCLGDRYLYFLEKNIEKKIIRLNLSKIIPDKSLKNFVSGHWRGLVERIEYLKKISDKKHQQNEIISFLKNANHQAAVRNTFYVKEALEIMNRRFQNIRWRKHWHNILADIKDMINIITESGLYASLKEDNRFRNFSYIVNFELERAK